MSPRLTMGQGRPTGAPENAGSRFESSSPFVCQESIMSVYLDVIHTDRQVDSRERRDDTVRSIGEILPLVLARYELGCVDRDPEFRWETVKKSGD